MDGEPEFRELIDPQHRYVFKRRFLELHPFYDQLCLACGELNYRKRGATATCAAASRSSPAGA